jgi:hypothetical protein
MDKIKEWFIEILALLLFPLLPLMILIGLDMEEDDEDDV